MLVTIYGEGGFDSDKPNNNIVEQYEVADPEPSSARTSAMEKLTALGLTEDEINALLGRQ